MSAKPFLESMLNFIAIWKQNNENLTKCKNDH